MSREYGKIITISSVKGGVGKTTTVLNLAGIYFLMKKKVLIIDLDLFSGGIATLLNIDNNRDIYTLIDSLYNNRFTSLEDYVIPYNKGIDIIASPRDPRDANKIEGTYIERILEMAKSSYDIILLDTNHVLNEISLTAIDKAYNNLFILTNDLVDIKNMRNILSILKDNGMNNYYILLNNSRDTGKDFIDIYNIRNMIDGNIDYTLSRKFYIKNIDKYYLNGEILTLNKNINKLYSKEINNIKLMAESLIKEKEVSDE